MHLDGKKHEERAGFEVESEQSVRRVSSPPIDPSQNRSSGGLFRAVFGSFGCTIVSHSAILAAMGKRQQLKLLRLSGTLGGRTYRSTHAPTHFAVVKATAPALRSPVYQLVPYGGITLDELRQEILAHLHAHRADSQYWRVDLWDANHVPPGAIPGNVAFSSQASSDRKSVV